LDLMYQDICGSCPTASWNGHEYFITYIDDYYRYGYLYLLHEKSQSLNMFKMYKAEVENQLNRKIKTVDLIVVVSTTADTTDQVNVQNHLSNSERAWHCRLVHHARDTSSK